MSLHWIGREPDRLDARALAKALFRDQAATLGRIGKFEEAHEVTVLLDEISEMHPRLQAKLLHAIQEREIDRLGAAHRSGSTSA